RALRWREFLDALLFTNSLLLVFWLMGLGDLIAKSPLSLSQKAAHLLVFLDYALLMGLAIYRGLNASGRFANALGWMLAAFFLVSAGNLAWIGLDLRGLYHAGHPMDALFLLIASLYLLAALAPLPAESLPATKAARLSSLLLPYLPFLMALPMIIYRISHLRQGQDAVALWLGTGMMALLLLRQLVALWDSLLFSRSLEAQVRERTRALEESQALLLRNQRMNIMATLGAGLAHDLNNLLSVIVMTTDLLEEETQAGQAPKPRDLSALRNASTQASDLVKKLMAFGRRAESESHLFDLRERIQGIAKLLEKLATPAVRVEWEHDPNPLYLELDPMHIEQILVNLVANARDAMPTGGRIRIRTRLHQGPEGSLAELAVSDSGTGIPEEHRGQLFDAFFTTKEPGKGTGLGLASVKAIADECLATITVESVVSLGTTFTLRFPLAP
ncbi:MAG: ATP-binding protein, partial [Holophaga sp.]